MEEYGSEFYYDNVKRKNQNNFWNFGMDKKFLFSGRTALDYVLKEIKKENQTMTIYIPNYICESVINTIKDNDFTIKFYTVDAVKGNFKYNINLNEKIDVFFGMNYFGLEDNSIDEYISYFSNKNIITIEDITHRLLSNKNFCAKSDYLICSLRKWFPIISGGIAVSNKKNFTTKIKLSNPPIKYVLFKKLAMRLKKYYILKKQITVIKKVYLKIFNKCQKMLDSNYQMKKIDNYSLKYINTIEIEKIRKKRIANAKYIEKNLKNKYIKPLGYISNQCCPLFIPCISTNKEILKKNLIKNNIYFPSHWPICNENRKYHNGLFDNEISIVCDQRYDISDVKKMVNYINKIESEIHDANNN